MPHRFVSMTYNLWAEHRWPVRAEPLRSYLALARPDLLCVQELRPGSRDLVDEVLTGHARVDDPFEGWVNEGNIYWSTDMFDLVEYGAEDIGQLSPRRRLFWTRLTHRASATTLVVSTAHLTWQGNEPERTEGRSPRIAETTRALAALEWIVGPDEPLLFVGDLNDATNVTRLLRSAGLTDSFTGSGTSLVPTHPAAPTATGNPQVLDWQFHRGPIRAMNSNVGGYYFEDLSPSDHLPVIATYALEP